MKIELPEKINLSSSEKYILFFRISDERSSFSIYNPVEDGSFFYYEIEEKFSGNSFENIKEFFYVNDFLLASYRKVFVVNNTSAFTFVPVNIFNEEKKENFFQFNFSDVENKLLIQTMRKPELVILHTISKNVFDFFNRSFIAPQYIHHLSPLFSYFSEKLRLGNANKLIINLQDKGLDILCFAPSGDFLFANHFKYAHLNDVVYYIFFIWKQTNLNQLKDFIYVAGNSSQKAELITQLQKYVQNVFPVNITPSEHFSGLDIQHVPFDLTALTLCEL
ncbi:MAG: DUF3822 family protein [Candidatus Azobacteroides sp.]|nr:DUF3822 family protein [Candidatus Azobacteroides sp.]